VGPTRIVMIALALCAVALGAPGCGEDAEDAVQSVRSEVSGAVARARTSVRDDIDRAQERVDDLVRDAQDRGVPTARIRQQADRAVRTAREEAERTIARAEGSGRDQVEIDRLRAETERRLRALRERIDAALDGG